MFSVLRKMKKKFEKEELKKDNTKDRKKKTHIKFVLLCTHNV